mmetsp:Transcript_19912/g.32305  ORF Transcript_19912/g.32305 Transcript_19912/m.32305 type:complete len:85 (+) Transcript_19912:115-369(+)
MSRDGESLKVEGREGPSEVARVISALRLREDESERLRVECRSLAAALAAREAHIRTLEEKVEALGGETGRDADDSGTTGGADWL